MVATKEKQAAEYENSIADRDRIISRYIPLIKYIAKGGKSEGQESRCIDHEDLYQDSILKMCNSYASFAESRSKLADQSAIPAYEAKWVVFCVRRGVRRSRLMRKAGSISYETSTYKQRYAEIVGLSDESGRPKSEKAIAEIFGKSIPFVKRLADAEKFTTASVKSLNEIYHSCSTGEQEKIDDSDFYDYVVRVAKSVMRPRDYLAWTKCYMTDRHLWSRKPHKRALAANERLKAELEARGEFHCG